MKHISAFFDRVEQPLEKFAWLPIRSSFSKKFIWMKKYVELHIFFDETGRPPITGQSWKLIYSKNEYLLYLLKKENKCL